MGIQGLWPVLKSTRENIHISDLDGTTLAVDGYGWMHRGAHACATELARGEPTTKHVRWFLRKLAKLRRHRIRAIVVFDGRALPAKSATNMIRPQVCAKLESISYMAAYLRFSSASAS